MDQTGRYTLPHQSTPRGDAGRRTTSSQRAAINTGVRDARKRVLRERARQDAERRRRLGLMGNITEATGSVADFIARGATSVPTTGAGPTFGGLGPNKPERRGGGRIAAAMAPRGVDLSESEVFGNLLHDAIAYPLLAPAALYEVGAAGVEAVQGKTDRAERLAKGLTEGVIGLAAQGRWSDLADYMVEHPLFALAEARGGAALAGRGGGAVARSGIAGERGRRIGSMERSDRDLGGGVTERRHYSPDLIVKGGQVLADRLTGNRAPNVEGRLRNRADFSSDAAHAGNRVARDDEAAAAFEARPTRASSRAGRAVERRLPTGRGAGRVLPSRLTRPERDIVSLVMQRVVRSAGTLKDDLTTELGRLNREYENRGQFRSGEQARANRVQAQAIARVLNDPRALQNAERIAASADTLTRRSNRLEQRAVDLEALDPESAARAKLFPYAQTHMDARYSDAPFQASRAKERESAGEVRAATRRVEQLKKREVAHQAKREERKRTNARADTKRNARHKGVTGTPGVPAGRAEWFHGTPGEFDGMPTAKGQWSDLGVYLTSDAKYARKYAAGDAAVEVNARGKPRGGRVLPIRVNPKAVLDMRAGRHSKKGLQRVIKRLRAEGLEALRKNLDADPYARNGRPRKMAEDNWKALTDGVLLRWAERLNRKKPLSVQESKELQNTLMEFSQKVGELNGRRGTGNRHQTLKDAIVAEGYDAIRKVDQAADALVVLNEKIMREPPVTRTRRKRAEAEVEAKAARERFDKARRERTAQQVGSRNVFKDEHGNEVRSFPTMHDRDGKRLTNEQIIDHMRKAGVPFDGDSPLVAYLPHRPDVRGARAYYQTAFAGRRDLNKEARTGEAQRKGTYDAGYNLPTEHLVRLRGVIGRIEQHDQLIRDQGVKRPDGRYFTWEEAEDFAANYRADSHGEPIQGRVELVPLRVAPAKYDTEQMARLLERQDPQQALPFEQLMEHTFADRLNKPGNTGVRNVVLIPKATADRLKEQMKPAGGTQRVGNLAASLFRTTVLPFSFKWLVGNSAEAALRLAFVGAGPNTHRIGKLVVAELRKIDTEQARQAEASLLGGLQFGQKGLTVNRQKSEQFADTPYYGAAKAIELAARVPPVKLAVGSIKAYTQAVLGFNRWMERHAQTAALGKWSKREMQEMTGSWIKANRALEAAAKDVANGLLETKNVHDAAKYIDETLGKYSRFSPGMRRFIQTVAPFLPWYMNAVRFVAVTLPVKHPIKVALLTRVEATIQQDWEDQHKNLPPGELKAAIPDGEGGWVDIARYGPFGAWTGPLGGDIAGIVDPFFPQFSTAYKALATGSSFTGRKIKPKPGDERSEAALRLSVAANSLIEGFVPLVQIGRRIREGGSTPYDTSNLLSPKTKPGTEDTAANRILNPIRPIRLGAAPAKSQPAPRYAPSREDVEFERMMRGSEAAAPEIDEEEFERMLRAAGG